jgi:ParB family chromosome partitioning protein
VLERDATDQQKLELAIIENIQRQDLNAIEEARSYQALIDLFSLTQEQAAARVGKSRSNVANTLRLLELDPGIQQALMEGKISRSHARTLLAEPDHGRRQRLFEQMLQGGMTVREAEARAGSAVPNASRDPNIEAIERELREALGTKVSLSMKAGAGKISIQFYSKDELKDLIKKLTA